MDGARAAEGGKEVTGAMIRVRPRVDGRLAGGLQWLWRARWQDRTRQEAIADRTGASWRGRSVGRMAGQLSPLSGREWQGTQPCQGESELGFPRPALWQMKSEAAGLAGDPSGQGEEPPSEGLGGYDLLTETDAGGPAGQQLCWLSRGMGNFCGTRTTPWRAIFDHSV